MKESPLWLKLSEKTLSVWKGYKDHPDLKGLEETVREKYNKFQKIYLSIPPGCSESDLTGLFPQAQITESTDDFSILKKIFSETESACVVFCDGLFPLLNESAMTRMLEVQTKYRADFSFSEIHPPGTTPMMYGRDILAQWEIHEFGDFPENEDLSEFVRKNINKFHVEVRYEEPDLRLLRLDFTCSTERSILETMKIFPEVYDKREILPALEEAFKMKPSLLRQFPGYIELEFSSSCEYSCTFCIRQFVDQKPVEMSKEVFSQFKDGVQKLPVPVNVCVGGYGEPLQHPEAAEMLAELLAHERIETLVLETNGVYLDSLPALLTSRNIDRLKVIININSLKRYSELHGSDQEQLERIKSKVIEFKKKVEDKKTKPEIYIQMLKIIENEDEVDAIYELCEELGVEFLFQKYNSFAGQMPEKRVSDMTPLERFPCWHLRRDLVIRADGSVPFCRQDVSKTGREVSLNDLMHLWDENMAAWEKHYLGDYSSFDKCKSCDEYYTFNL